MRRYHKKVFLGSTKGYHVLGRGTYQGNKGVTPFCDRKLPILMAKPFEKHSCKNYSLC